MSKKEKNPVREVFVFGIGFGILAGIAAYFILMGLKNAPNLWGFKRNIAIGIPLLIISIAFLFSGITLLAKRTTWAVICCMLSTLLATGFYFIFEISTIGFFQARLVSLIAYALPFIMLSRSKAAISYINSQRIESPNSDTATAESE